MKLGVALLAGSVFSGGLAAATEPVLLIHGLWGNANSWGAYADHLRSAGWSEGCLVEFGSNDTEPHLRPATGTAIGGNLAGAAAWMPETACVSGPRGGRAFFRVVFRDNDGQSFEMQGSQVGAAVDLVRKLTGAGKVALVGHSMGGLAARAYIQSNTYRGGVAAVATVATPHLGSLIPYLVNEPSTKDCRWLAARVGKDFEAPAVRMLAPDSQEMLSLNRMDAPFGSIPNGVRIGNVVATFEVEGQGACSPSGTKMWLARWQKALSKYFDPAKALSLASGKVLANWTDGVVPAVSQYIASVPPGYKVKAELGLVKAFHSDATDAKDTWTFLDHFLGDAARTKSPLELALVLDSSGSMAENDPGNLRREGARLLVDRCPPGSRFTLVRFASETRVLVARSGDSSELKRGLEAIGAEGGTRMCLGLSAARETLRGAPAGSRKAAVVFTDGLSEDKCTAEEMALDGVMLFSVGLSRAADGATLQAMAAATGGAYVHALSAGDLQAVFDVVAAGLLDEATLLDVAGRAVPGATTRQRFPVDASVSSLIGSVTWTGSDLDLALVSPSGRRYEARTAGVSAGTYESVRVDAPEKGEWQAIVKSVDVPSAGEPFRLRISADSPVRLSVEPLRESLQTGRPVELAARLDGFPVGTSRADVSVTRPGGSVVPLESSLEGEALRATFLGAEKPGPYSVRWAATRGAVSRVALQTIFIGGAEVVSRVGNLQRVEGQYAVWNRGAMHGVRAGLTIQLYRGTRRIGTARVVDVRLEESDLEVDEVTGVPELRPGDRAEVDPMEWTGETK